MNIEAIINLLSENDSSKILHGVFTLNSGARIITGYFDLEGDYIYCITPLMYLNEGTNYCLTLYNPFAGTMVEVIKRDSIQSFALCNGSDLRFYKSHVNKTCKFEFYKLEENKVYIKEIQNTNVLH